MSKTISLIIGMMAVATVVYSFFGNSLSGQIFGIEMNIWVYRLIWSVLAVLTISDYFNKKKK
jgi:hypothetical protein